MSIETERHPRFLLYGVRGESMLPTLRSGDLVLVRTAATSKRVPSRGDVVVVNHRGEQTEQAEHEAMKRIVALPGERIDLRDGMLLIDGERLRERYLRGLPAHIGSDAASWALGDGEYFVMGDNRAHSTDSRAYGPLRREQITGRAVCRIWPPLRWGFLRR